ncbi:MAG TPA: BMP family ABC transporter substrate-binding protein, partial [Bacillota bacterium]|nr:BMP family ABC transporter substrate-binding protein [Bacillota bacterium]
TTTTTTTTTPTSATSSTTTTTTTTTSGTTGYQIAMVTDSGGIDDKSFNQGTWEGIIEYATAHSKTYKYYKPAEVSDAAYLAAIGLAVTGGAEIVITPGYLFESAIYEAQTLYPNVKFVLIDGEPHTPDYVTYNTASNTLCILFDEQEAGFFAGYAAVIGGMDNLGFFGGMAVPAVVRFGIGYVAGAYYAAEELGNANSITFDASHYHYLGSFAPSNDAKTMATTWFNSGVDVLFAAAGGAGSSAMAAAEELTGKWTIGVDKDQSQDSLTVVTSALKGVGEAAISALTDFYGGTFVGGRTISLGAAEGGVALPADFSRFGASATAVETAYNALFTLVVNGTVVVPTNDTTSLPAFLTALGVNAAQVTAISDKAE